MKFNSDTRELTSNTGFIKSKDNNIYVNYPIYLGIYDDVENYEECSEEEYNNWIQEKENVNENRNFSE